MPGSTQRGLRIVVQSEREPTHLEERVEAFLASMKATIRDMPNGEFTEQKQGLQRKWRESDKNLTEEANRFWGHISNGQLDFMRSSLYPNCR
jgi:insulysin